MTRAPTVGNSQPQRWLTHDEQQQLKNKLRDSSSVTVGRVTLPMARWGPVVRGKCPACGLASLFLGSGGYITCQNLSCSDPTAACDLLLPVEQSRG